MVLQIFRSSLRLPLRKLLARFSSSSLSAGSGSGSDGERKPHLPKGFTRIAHSNSSAIASSHSINGEVQGDDDLQGHWRSMESRVLNRPAPKPRADGKRGRGSVPATDEDYWLQGGLYDRDNSNINGNCSKGNHDSGAGDSSDDKF